MTCNFHSETLLGFARFLRLKKDKLLEKHWLKMFFPWYYELWSSGSSVLFLFISIFKFSMWQFWPVFEQDFLLSSNIWVSHMADKDSTSNMVWNSSKHLPVLFLFISVALAECASVRKNQGAQFKSFYHFFLFSLMHCIEV